MMHRHLIDGHGSQKKKYAQLSLVFVPKANKTEVADNISERVTFMEL